MSVSGDFNLIQVQFAHVRACNTCDNNIPRVNWHWITLQNEAYNEW